MAAVEKMSQVMSSKFFIASVECWRDFVSQCDGAKNTLNDFNLMFMGM